jgi:hypothetical protein
MIYEIAAALMSLGLFVGMMVLLEIGRRIGVRYVAEDPEHATEGVGPLAGAVFGLMGLLLAFTFSGAAARYDVRREQIVQEANAIGTAYLRVDLLPSAAQPALRDKFRRYVDSRLATYRKVSDTAAFAAESANGARLQNEIWKDAVAACRDVSPAATQLMTTALNEMIDITTTRFAARWMHPPVIVFAMLYAVTLVSALLAGYDTAVSKRPSRVHTIGFAIVISLAVYVIMEIELPRIGMIRLDAFDQLLVDVRRTMD